MPKNSENDSKHRENHHWTLVIKADPGKTESVQKELDSLIASDSIIRCTENIVNYEKYNNYTYIDAINNEVKCVTKCERK